MCILAKKVLTSLSFDLQIFEILCTAIFFPYSIFWGPCKPGGNCPFAPLWAALLGVGSMNAKILAVGHLILGHFAILLL